MDILEQGGQSNYHGPEFDPNAPRRQQFAGGYGQSRSQQRQPPHRPNPSYSYDQPAPPSLEKADYYSPQASLDQHPRDIFAIKPYKPRKPWYRTPRGLVIIFIILLLLIGGAVGAVFGVRASTNKVNAEKKSAQQGGQSGTSRGGVAPTSAARGSEGESTNDPNALPTLPSLSLVRLDSATQDAAPATSRNNLVITLNANPAPAASAVVQSGPAVTAPRQGTRPTRTTPALGPTPNVGPTSNVDPVCARFPSLPACRQR